MAQERPETDDREGIVDRKLTFCARLRAWPIQQLVSTCKCCSSYFVHCCGCDMGEWDKVTDLGFSGQQAQTVWEAAIANRVTTNTTCHHYRLLFVSGSTFNGGKENAVGGLGFTFGKKDGCQGSLVVDEEIDPGKTPATAQRAEILAAIEGLLALSCWESAHEKKARRSKGRGSEVDDKHWVIACDGQLFKSMTDDLPKWKNSNRKKGEGNEPANADVLQILHSAIVAEEAKQRVTIGFWKIPRARNAEALNLAKAGRSKFTSAELAELAKQHHAEKQAVRSEVGSNKLNDGDGTKTALELKTTSSNIPKSAAGQDTKGKGKANQGNAVTTEGYWPADGEAPTHDRLTNVLNLDEDLDDELHKYPWGSGKPASFGMMIKQAMWHLFLQQSLEHADKWTGAYVYFLLLASSEVWRGASLFVVRSCVHLMLILIGVQVVSIIA